MIWMCNTTLRINNIEESLYNKLIDFLEDNKINFDETDFEDYEVDTRSEEEKWTDYYMNKGMDKARGIE